MTSTEEYLEHFDPADYNDDPCRRCQSHDCVCCDACGQPFCNESCTVIEEGPEEDETSPLPIGTYRDKEGVLRDAWNGNKWEAA